VPVLPRTALVSLVAALAAAVLTLTACSSSPADDPTESFAGTPPSSVVASGTAPIVFAFVCAVGGSGEEQTYTTASAVWQDHRTDCSVERITGTEPSAQQRSAVAATSGVADLETLARACAVSGTAPWTTPVASRDDALLAAGLERYCPGHPEIGHLRAALAAWQD
jgi:hypothetical protein